MVLLVVVVVEMRELLLLGLMSVPSVDNKHFSQSLVNRREGIIIITVMVPPHTQLKK